MEMSAHDDQRATLLQTTSQTLERLSQVGQEITAHLDAEAVFQVLNRHVHAMLDAHAFAIYLADRDCLILQRAFCVEAGKPQAISHVTVSHPAAHAARCVRERSEIMVEHDDGAHDGTPQPGLTSLLMPMKSGERIIGVMSVQSVRPRPFDERERMIFRTLCAYGSIAFANAANFHQLESTLAALHETRDLLAKAANDKMQDEQLARQKAEEATRLKSEFLANMSHEIRNPMNAIIGMAHLALRTELNLRQQDYITKIHAAGLSLLGLINDILDFSKIEAGKLEMEAIPFSLDEVLNNVASVTSQRATEKQLEYLFNIAPEVPHLLLGDPLRLSQVLINLVNNAIKFTEQGDIELQCNLVSRTDKVALRFAVRDTGIGMSDAQLGKLFQPFSQADGSTTRKYGGTGLGLSISQHLVALMGGKIEIESHPDQGSTFHFVLELAVPDASAMPAAPTLPVALRQGKVLVVDDHPLAQHTLVRALQAHGLCVDGVGSGIAAMRALIAADQAGAPYQLVMADWHMPKMDGLELMRRIQERPAPPGLLAAVMPTVILLAAFGREENLPDLEPLGFGGLVFKPYSQSSLLSALSKPFAAPNQTHATRPAPQYQFTGTSVLLAEDNDINQQIVLELLGTVGICVDIANTGVEAVNKLLAAGAQGYSAILMDLEMPEMNGHQATVRIRQEARFDHLPIIAMTAHALADMREQCAREGMQDYLTKPISPEQLYQTLARWIARPPKAVLT